MICLVDSGSAITLGDVRAFEDFEDKRPLTKCILIKTLLSSQVVSDEVVVQVPLEFGRGEETMSVKLLNFESKKFHCILGVNILSALNMVIDFSSRILKIGNKYINFMNITDNQSNDCESFQTYCASADKFPAFNIVSKKYFNIDYLLNKDLSAEERHLLANLINKNKPLFYQEGQQITATSKVKHQIITTPHTPIYCKNYRYPFALEEEINKQVDDLIKNNIIRHSNSPYNSPLWIVEKHADNSGVKKWRLVIDYRKLNKVTIDDKFPLPNIEALFEKLGRAQYFSTIDLAKGFYQIGMYPNDIEKTAFSSSKGHFEFIRMPFGLKNAPATFQRMINNVLDSFINKICIIYMDDILVFSTSLHEHIESLTKIFKKLSEHNLKIQMDKCQFLRRETKFLGHVITPDGIKPGVEKTIAIQKVKLPTTVKEIKSFLGLSGFYRKFIHNYSLIAAPIVKYLRKDMKIDVNDNAYIQAFNKLKRVLTSPPLLSYPNFAKKFTVTTDASDVAIGAVLSQDKKPICFASRTLNGFERKYHILEKELLAIIWACRYFRPYLYGRKFLIQTDNQPLTWLSQMKDPNARILRWKTLLNEYDYEVEFIAGKENKVADFLSRSKPEKQENENEDIDIKSLFENSVTTVHSANENLNEHFQISDFLINKYSTQIRIVKKKNIEFKKLFKKYSIIYVESTDLNRDTYLTDLFRKYIIRGKIGIHSELPYNEYNIVQEKLINLFSNNNRISFTKCNRIAEDILNQEQMLEIIEECHNEGNHRGVEENYEQLKWRYFQPNLKKLINRYINCCKVCNENKYDRHPFKKKFAITETPDGPNEIVHMDIFYVCKTMFLTSIDRFTKMASAHKLSDKNMCTVVTKIQERIAWLGKPKKLILDNEFNNALIKMFCNEHNITPHFCTPHSHTGNSDVERLHATLLDHIRIIKNTNENVDTEETVIKAVGFYNNTIHRTINMKPIDFLNKDSLNFKEIKEKMSKNKIKAIQNINIRRENEPNYDMDNRYLKNPLACRNKTAKKFIRIGRHHPNKIDIDQLKRPLKSNII